MTSKIISISMQNMEKNIYNFQKIFKVMNTQLFYKFLINLMRNI